MFTVDHIQQPIASVLTHAFLGPAVLVACGVMLLPFAHWLVLLITLTVAAIPLTLHFVRAGRPVKAVNWWEEVIIVTGGSHGVGLALVKMLMGVKPKRIVVLDINAPPADLNGDMVRFYRCDVSSKTSVKEVAAKVISECGNPTMVVNNAGIVNGRLLMETTDEQVERVVGVNLMGVIWMTRAFLPGMIASNRGHILNVASVLGLTGARYVTDYCASKFAVVGFGEALRQEVAHTDVKVSTIYPGLILTGMFDGVTFRFPWLTPPLSTETVATNMFNILRDNRSTEVKLPFFSALTPLLRVLPVEIVDFVKEVTGSNDSMSHQKREKKKE